ncbi:uncharacterized protein LOC129719949 [Wyeomyia smithii]|uniref:uncharacterized protein LOC129719949 n=1 Tax=Wyeomyia smithii TaxID=174621 RepID=UPI0024680A37|nr:uncharacterized protein LOC129719949 [Wyeomyia smithii]
MADNVIKEKIKRREHMFASLKRHIEFLETYSAETQHGQVSTRVENLDKKWEEFEMLQEEIAELDENGDYEEDHYHYQYFQIRSSLLEKMAPTNRPAEGLDNTIGRNNSAMGVHSGVRLPQITLPDFDSDYRDWLSFKSTYESLIHETVELSGVQKFHYLKPALKGEAAKLIESLMITNDNYTIAWETIPKRYSNEYLLKKRHLQALMEYPKI